MSKQKIKVGYCVAYDWYLLQHSLPQVYDEADEICLSVDANHCSWTGNPFAFDEEGFKRLIAAIDVKHKIRVYRDNFYVPELSPMQNEVRQRNMIAAFLGKDEGWHVQLDADEYFMDFTSFVRKLRSIHTTRKVNVCCPFLILFKQTPEGFLYINNGDFDRQEMIPVATNSPQYEFGRKNGYFNIVTNSVVLHQSWARSEAEIQQKLANWGHNKDFDLERYFRFWKELDVSRYSSIRMFHPFKPDEWEGLGLLEARSVEDMITRYRHHKFFHISNFRMALKNSIWYSRFKKLIG